MTDLRSSVAALAVAVALGALVAGCAQAPGANTAPATPQAPAGGYTPNPQPAQETELQYRARLHTELGANYFARGQFDVAIEELNEALRLVPTYATAYSVMALVQLDLGEFDRAEKSFQQAIQLAPQDPEIHNNYGWFLCVRGREREGMAQFDLALRNPLYRTPELAMLNSGRCQIRLGDLRAAESYFRRVQSLQPGNVKAAQGLAEIAYREGRLDEARSLLRAPMQQPLPDTLLLAGCVERRAGDRTAERAVAARLRSLYPDAPELAALEGGSCP